MKYTLHINQALALELGIKNINQAHIFDLLTTASTWAKPEIIGAEVYYWVARQNICTELPLLNLKPDTVYRHLKGLNVLGLIDYQKVGKKDCIRITDLGRKYLLKNENEHYVGNKSELNENSEINPNKLGNKSENDSEINPTYPTTNTNPTTNITVEVISYLNEKANKNFKHNTDKTISLINARVKEGYTLEDFKLVIDKKVTAWKNDNRMKPFIRPITLFGTKFESYLNEDVAKGTFNLGDKDYTETEDF